MSGDNCMGGVIISPNLKRSSDRVDLNGNKINPKTKEVIEPLEETYQPTNEELAGKPTADKPEQSKPINSEDYHDMSVKQLRSFIESKEDELEDLKKFYKEKVRKLRAELDELEEI